MPAIQELERDYLSTPIPFAEIATLETLKRVDMYPGLGRDSVLTEETGFPLWLEMNRFFNDLNFALSSGMNLAEALRFATDELEVNIRTYTVEFIKSETVLPHKNRFDVVDGVSRMVGNNKRPLLDAISSQERRGSVLQASRVVEFFLTTGDPNSFAVMMSPDGWSGYVDRSGQSHNHLNAETMIFWKDQQGVLKGLTLVTDLKQDQAAEVMKSLGVPEQALGGISEEDRLVNIVRNPALLRSDANPFEYVLDKILAVRGRENIRLLQKEGPPEIRPIEETRKDIQRFDELLLFGQKEEELIFNLREFIMGRIYQLGGRNAQEAITKEIERTVLKLAGEHLRKNTSSWKGFSDVYRASVIQYPLPQDIGDFRMEIAFLKSRAGCPTGGGSGRGLRGISLGSAVTWSSGGSREAREGVCSECGMPSLDSHYHCPECNLKYADETGRSPDARTKQCGCGFQFGC